MARYRFRTSWQIAAPLAPVYAAIEDSLDWPQRWPGVVSVNQLHSGDAAGIGNVRRYCWRGRLPYRVVFDITLAAKQPGRRLEGHACGDVCGTGIWLFAEAGDATAVQYDWLVSTSKAWMNLLAPLASPLFRWNHDWLMQRGGEALAHKLGTRLLASRHEHI